MVELQYYAVSHILVNSKNISIVIVLYLFILVTLLRIISGYMCTIEIFLVTVLPVFVR